MSRSKDHPSIQPPKRKGPRPRTGWKVKGPGESQNNTDTKEEGTGPRAKVKVIETPIFIPFTRDSVLKKALQNLDDTLGEAMGCPGVRFIERCGGQTVAELLGSSNPWARALKF